MVDCLNPFLKKLITRIKPIFEDANGAHDFYHTLRVRKLARHIARVEGADLSVVEPAALLHDIARAEEDRSSGGICHAREGAIRARKILSELGVDPSRIDHVCRCIRTHRYRRHRTPQSLEARVLFDADKLDSIGACGIGRAFLFAGAIGATLHIPRHDISGSRPYTPQDTAYREYRVKLRHVRDRMMTAEGRRMAQKRHAFMETFFRELEREVTGRR